MPSDSELFSWIKSVQKAVHNAHKIKSSYCINIVLNIDYFLVFEYICTYIFKIEDLYVRCRMSPFLTFQPIDCICIVFNITFLIKSTIYMPRGDLQNHLTKRTGLCWIIWGIVQLFPIGTRSSLAFLLQIRHKTSLCAQAKGKMAERVLSFSKPAKVRCCYLTTFTWITHEKTRVLLRQSSDWGYTLRYWVLRSVKIVDSHLPVGIEAASTCCFHYMAWSCSLVNKTPAERGLLRRKGVELILLGFFPSICQSDWQLLKFSLHFREQAAAGDEAV